MNYQMLVVDVDVDVDVVVVETSLKKTSVLKIPPSNTSISRSTNASKPTLLSNRKIGSSIIFIIKNFKMLNRSIYYH